MRAYPAFGTRFDTVLYVRGSSCFDGLEVACNDNRYGRRTTASGRSGGSRLEVNVNAGETYYVVVDGAYGSTGRFTLVINPPVPTAGTTATDPDTGPTPSDTPLDPDAGDPPSDEHPVAQRCQRVTDSTGDSRPPLEIHTVDRFGDTTAVVQDALRLCTPIETSPSTSDDPSVIRFDITIREHLPTSLADAVHVANELGEMILDVLEPASVQTAAVIDTAPPESIAAAVEAPLATCYKVRASDGSADSWTLDVTLDDPPQQVTLIGPTRLCTTEHPVDDDAAAEVHLCYRMRTAIPDSATVWVTSTLGSDRVDLGATDEICLPSTIVDEPN